MAQEVKNLPAKQEMQVQSLDKIQKIVTDTFCPDGSDEEALGIKDIVGYFVH